jgi:hypothetical protein
MKICAAASYRHASEIFSLPPGNVGYSFRNQTTAERTTETTEVRGTSLGMRASAFGKPLEILKIILMAGLLFLGLGCSPRDFLTRRLAGDLISQSEAFKLPQTFWLTTGLVSNKEFNSPESMVLQRRGWTIGTQEKCPVGLDPPPCWDVELSPLGVTAIRPLIGSETQRGPFGIEVAQRTLEEITGISKDGNFADVEFLWHWAPLNQVGTALYDSGVRYRSIVALRKFDNGWRVMNGGIRSGQTMDEALRNAEALAP